MDELARLKDDLEALNDDIAYFTRGVVWPEDYAELDWLIGRRAQVDRAIYEIESGLSPSPPPSTSATNEPPRDGVGG